MNKSTEPRVTFPSLAFMLKDLFSLPTLLTIGAVAQLLLLLLLPFPLALLPVNAAATYALATTAPALGTSPSNFPVVHGRTSANLPCETGESLVVLLLGVRFNSPLGFLSPNGREIGKHFFDCISHLERHRSEYGLLGLSHWRGDERSANNTLLTITYFRSVEGLEEFAAMKVHMLAWKWGNRAGHEDIGFFSETYIVKQDKIKTGYRNMHPLLLGAVGGLMQKPAPAGARADVEKED